MTSWRKSTFSGGEGNCVEVGMASWRKSAFSGGQGSCVEVGTPRDDMIGIRDTTQASHRDHVTLTVSPTAWRTFTTTLKNA